MNDVGGDIRAFDSVSQETEYKLVDESTVALKVSPEDRTQERPLAESELRVAWNRPTGGVRVTLSKPAMQARSRRARSVGIRERAARLSRMLGWRVAPIVAGRWEASPFAGRALVLGGSGESTRRQLGGRIDRHRQIPWALG